MSKCENGNQQKIERDLDSKLEKTSSKKEIRINNKNMIRKQQIKITDIYQIGDKIGAGAFGSVYKIYHKKLGITRALKIFKKEQINNNNSSQQLQILKHLDHPNVLKVYQYFQTPTHWQIVTDYFEGRQLFDEIINDKGISQQKAAQIFAEICKALSYIHAHQIVHRDLKPENILVKKNIQGEYEIKLIDWGLGSLAVTQMIRKCGTPQYCSPQVIKGNYGYQCDLWSLGVVLFVMLVGKFPFKGQNTKQTLSLVLRGNYNFNGPQWHDISIEAKTLIVKLLKKDPKQRITAAKCLEDVWVTNNLQKQIKRNETKLFQALQRIKQVNYDNKFQAMVINFIKNYLQTTEQQMLLKKQFQQLDTNKDGVLSYEQLKKGYQKIYGNIQAQRIVQDIFKAIDTNCSNSIQYSQFITFGSRLNHQFSNQQIKQAFKAFDINNDGKINKKQLNTMLEYQKGTQSQDFDNLISQIDKDKDGQIDIDQFIESINKIVQNAIKKQQDMKKDKQFKIKIKINTQQIAQNVLEQLKYKKLTKKTSLFSSVQRQFNPQKQI